jgi:hypothetical protein
VTKPPQQISIKEAATLLLLMHGKLFGKESLESLASNCQIQFTNEADLARGFWEWFYFGLYAVVDGIQNNFRSNQALGKEIAQELFAEVRFHLEEAGLSASELATKQRDIRKRLEQFDSVANTGQFEKIGFVASSLVLGKDTANGQYPKSYDAFEFGIGANEYFVGCLKAINELFENNRVGS